MTAPVEQTAPPEVAAPPAPPAPVPTPPPAPPAAPPAEPAAPTEVEDTPEIAKVRKEAATYRTRLREQEAAATKAAEDAAAHATERDQLRDTLAKLAAVLNPDANEPPDPAKLAEQLAAEKAQRESDRATLTASHEAVVRDLTVRATLPAVAAKLGAHAPLVQAVLMSDGTLAKLDPASDTFATDLESAVKAALDAHPQLKVTPVVARSGAEIPGRSGGSDQLTREQVSAMKPAEIEAARVAGRLKNVLGG